MKSHALGLSPAVFLFARRHFTLTTPDADGMEAGRALARTGLSRPLERGRPG